MKISFCIPTYNRCHALDELLKSISLQKNHPFELEICISDNASTDATASLIDFWRKQYQLNIIYNKNEKNIGPDNNYLAAVNLATGEYCWLMGSDDMLSPDALHQLSLFISSRCELYLCDRTEFDINMENVRYEHRRWLNSDTSIFNLNNATDYCNYYDKCRTLGGVFSYLSSLIVKRDEWNKIPINEDYIGSAYVHVYVLLSMINAIEKFKLHYISQPLVFCRGDNDHFSENGKAKRVEIDLKAYTKLAHDLYTDEKVKCKFLGVLSRERPWFHTSLVVGHYGDNDTKSVVCECYKIMGKNSHITKLLFNLGTLGYYLNKLKFIHNKITPILRSSR